MKVNVRAVNALYPSVVVIRDGVAFDADENEIAIDIDAINNWYDHDQYQYDRASAYPSIQEQLDMLYWDSVNGTTTWADAIAQVKADYPKGAE